MSEKRGGTRSSPIGDLRSFGSRFCDQVLFEAPCFAKLNLPTARWDIIFIGGSSRYAKAGVDSDIDIFLVMPRRLQAELGIKPVYHFEFLGCRVEVSQLSTESMHTARNDKTYLIHWHEGILLRASSPQAEAAFMAARALSDYQLKQIVWTAYAEFMILCDAASSSPQLYDRLGATLALGNAVRSFSYAFLLSRHKCRTLKWLSQELLLTAPDVHRALSQLMQESALSPRFFDTLSELWQDLLARIGLEAKAGTPWYERNLDLQ